MRDIATSPASPELLQAPATAATRGTKASYTLPPGYPIPHTSAAPTCVVLKQLEDAEAAKAKKRKAAATAAAAVAVAAATQPKSEGQAGCSPRREGQEGGASSLVDMPLPEVVQLRLLNAAEANAIAVLKATTDAAVVPATAGACVPRLMRRLLLLLSC